MAAADQAARRDLGARVGDSAYVRALISGDSARVEAMSAILDEFGLPGRALVGAAGADAAMLIVQHNAALQTRALRWQPNSRQPRCLPRRSQCWRIG
jgi:hypothetical protein